NRAERIQERLNKHLLFGLLAMLLICQLRCGGGGSAQFPDPPPPPTPTLPPPALGPVVSTIMCSWSSKQTTVSRQWWATLRCLTSTASYQTTDWPRSTSPTLIPRSATTLYSRLGRS